MDTLIVAAVVAVRFVAPLLIQRFPLPAILVCLVADAVDQTIFQAFVGGELGRYQSYDKALDVYYLSFAFIVHASPTGATSGPSASAAFSSSGGSSG